jgi:prepilin-type N-terminal cleavage/methylation domain-containing protein
MSISETAGKPGFERNAMMSTIEKIRRNQAGFTLVEIAIVLVIIGLLIGGVLKGQAMVQNAKVKRVVKLADELRASVMTFYDKYGVYPGDENLAAIPPNGADAEGNGKIETAESFEVFRDLGLAGLIAGSYNGTNAPTHPFGDIVEIQWVNPPGNATPLTHYIMFHNLPADVCLEIDTKYDDGNWQTGSISGSAAYANGTNVATFYMLF